MTALNPLTNSRIIGEVEFYLIKNPYLEIFPKEDRYPTGKSLSLAGCYGTFIGSDYSYTYSESLQETILKNCIPENESTYMKF